MEDGNLDYYSIYKLRYDEYGNYYNAQGESAEVPIEYEEDLQGDPQIGISEGSLFS